MKFGQDLAEHQVPEWEAKYLDYKKGKKRLKKLVKKPSSLRTPLTIRGASSEQRQKGTRGDLSVPDTSKPVYQSVVNTNSPGMDHMHSFKLPSPALMPSDRHSMSQSSEESKKVNDTTPLLFSEDPKPVGHKDLGTPQSLSMSARRQSTVGRFIDNLKRVSSVGNSPAGGTEMDDLDKSAREDFIAWVNSELEKVEQFYKSREDACLDRYLVLQDQIVQLNEQKQRSARKLSRVRDLRQKRKTIDRPNVNSSEFADTGTLNSFEESSDDEETGVREGSSTLWFWAYLTKRKFRIINKFDTPSLPSFEWLRENGNVEKQYYEDDEEPTHDNRRDYRRRKQQQTAVPYFFARRRLKKAVYELYRSMELLRSYKELNRTAFRKLIKKYDKATDDSILPIYMHKIDNSYFVKSEILDSMMAKVENTFTDVFENGNRKAAITKLRSSENEKQYYFVTFAGALMLGIALPFFVYTVYLGLHKTETGILPEGRYMLQIWGGFFFCCLMALLFSVNCFVWTIYKVNYKFIFEFNQRDALDYRQFFAMSSIFFLTGVVLAWFSFENFWSSKLDGRNWPWIYLGVCAAIFVCPFDILYLNTRTWLLSSVFRLIFSGLYPVEFRDFFLGDVFCSLTYSISNLSIFFCLYATHWKGCLDGSGTTKCGSGRSRLVGFLSTLPSIWRFLQCFRRYADTGEWFPHLANMLKYTVSILYYMSLSLYRIDTIQKYRALLITFATINSIYSSIWDILMDWSLLQFDSQNYLLRDHLIFKRKWYYYLAMVVDVILRFQWIFYAFFKEQIQQSALTSFCIALAEIIRRFIWIFFRMENEHATNVHLSRASRESPLPYPVIARKHEIAPPSPATQEEQPQPATPIQRRDTIIGNISKMLNSAHIKDFQRRKTTKQWQKEDESEADDDDDDTQ
ncbi:hypothetical protein OGAPHI_005186 [Ogataea philodendri]|uniref:Protein SYG1 n=1 Tax=Ogataea philodendri TaxID=1378263 RepID=A0A9P8T2F1_9ASCO|nr:uncharacterized protein OGAPHI_005186 [Ogataea philodendri]KAH3663783.1 hypothetical protein OGAPHI_005186 [Ogataea philodendri]